MTDLKETRYGFNWGGARVERLASFEREGHGSTVMLGIGTTKRESGYRVEVYVTKTGQVTVFVDNQEVYSDRKARLGMEGGMRAPS